MTTDCDLVADANNFADAADYIYTHILYIFYITMTYTDILHLLHTFGNWRLIQLTPP